MRAILCSDFNGADALTLGDAPDPIPAPDELLIDVRAAAVSFMDKLMAEGGYQMRPDLPYVPGTDAAGIVAAVGNDVTAFKPGDRVVGQMWHGAYAAQAVTKHWKCEKILDGVDFVTASNRKSVRSWIPATPYDYCVKTCFISGKIDTSQEPPCVDL